MKYCKFIIHMGLLWNHKCVTSKEIEIEIEKLVGEKMHYYHKIGYKCAEGKGSEFRWLVSAVIP